MKKVIFDSTEVIATPYIAIGFPYSPAAEATPNSPLVLRFW